MLAAQGDHAGARKSYRDSLAIAQRLVTVDRGNTYWLNDLGKLAYTFVLAHDFATGLAVADQAISLAPDKIWLYMIRAACAGEAPRSLQESYPSLGRQV